LELRWLDPEERVLVLDTITSDLERRKMTAIVEQHRRLREAFLTQRTGR